MYRCGLILCVLAVSLQCGGTPRPAPPDRPSPSPPSPAPTRPGAAAPSPGPRARALGIPFSGTPGPLNAITDVAGIEVGHRTLISGDGKLVVGKGPVRTGVTAIFPRGKASTDMVFAASSSLNGAGEMTGTAWVAESGELYGPVLLTNTHSVGIVRDTAIKWTFERLKPGKDLEDAFSLPVVAETWDGRLNDIFGFHVQPSDVYAALDGAAGGPVAEGSVGGGTGMVCHGFKGGIGTASRVVRTAVGEFRVGALVQCNYGLRPQLRIAGIPVGAELEARAGAAVQPPTAEYGSIIVIIATDAPLLPHQLERLARRVPLALGRMGSVSGDASGDIFLAFSTANPGAEPPAAIASVRSFPRAEITWLFEATVDATEEAIVNALVAGRTMTGVNGEIVEGLPHDRVLEILRKHQRLAPPR
jgi:L-aminopeptidase/D-esterase-like protein